jgi:hypothetical protein
MKSETKKYKTFQKPTQLGKFISLVGLIGLPILVWHTVKSQDLSENYKPSNPYIKNISTHASYEILSDIDHDGNWDFLSREMRGQPKKMFFKEGFSP